jgi:O-antigen/teichoic acid export membrane protein
MPVSNIEKKKEVNQLNKVVWLFAGKALPTTVLLLITVLYSQKLTYSEYGQFQSVWMFSSISSVILAFGLPSLILSSDFNTLRVFLKQRLPLFVSLYFLLLTLISVVLFFYSADAVPGLWIQVLFLVLAITIASTAETFLIKFYGPKTLLALNSFYSLAFFFWHYYNLTLSFNLSRLLYGLIFLGLIKALACFLIYSKHTSFRTYGSYENFMSHWVHLGLNDVVGVLAKWIDKIVIIYLLTPKEFAVFFNGTYEIPLFSLIISSVSNISIIEMTNNKRSLQKLSQLFKQNFLLLSKLVFPAFFFFLFFGNDIFDLLFQRKYQASVPIFLISLLILPVRINDYTILLQCLKKGNYIFRGALLDIVLAVVLMALLYPLLGMRGVALATVVSTYIQATYYVYFSAKFLNLKIISLIPALEIIKSFIIYSIMFGTLFYFLQEANYLTRLIISGIVTVLVVVWGYTYCYRKSNQPLSV